MTPQSAQRRDRSVLAVALAAAATLVGACESQRAGAGAPPVPSGGPGTGAGTSAGAGQPAAALMANPADSAWEMLRAGNARYVSGQLLHPDRSAERREHVAAAQYPQAIILACSDSRVPPEIIFDTGLGDLFVVRVAGNTDVPAAVGSIEYAVQHLHAPLIVVLGHQRCGAVEAAVKAAGNGQAAPGQLDAVLAPIAPAVQVAKSQPGDIAANAIDDNVALVAERLGSSQPILAPAIREGRLKIIGCRYDLDSGEVTLVNRPGAGAGNIPAAAQ